jgi:hypothetical protein
MHEEEVFIAIAGMVTGILVLRIIANAATRVFCHWRDVALKMRLVEAGLDAVQIEQIVLAGRYEQKRSKEVAAINKQRPKAVYANR